MLKLGTSPTSESNAANITLMLRGLTGYFMTPFDAAFDPMKFDFDKDPAKVEETAALQDAEMTQVSSFLQHKGKLLLYHGMADPFFSALDTQRYYERLTQGSTDWARLFLVPGVSRPLCSFPQIPRYKGTGSTDDAANFACEASR